MTTDSQQQFLDLAVPHMDAMYRTARRMLRVERGADDLVQETYFKAYKNFHQFQSGTNFKAWIFKILVNAFRNQYRKHTSEPASVDIETVSKFYAVHGEDMFTSIEAEHVKFESLVSDEVKSAMESLPDEYREVVILALVEGFSYQEIAEMIDAPMGTVMSRLFRGRQMLKQRLADYAQSMGYVKRSKH